LPLGRNKTETSDTWDILNSGDFARFAVLTEDGCLVAHNCGYMLGAGVQGENYQTGEIEATGLLGYAWGMGVDLTPEMAKLSVKTFRAKFEAVVAFWYDMDAAVRRVIRTKKPETVGYLTIDYKKPFLRIRLPSGRHLHYMRPRMEKRRMPWKDANGNLVYKLSITYENLENGQWRRVTTHPGKLAENVTQAVARDILAHGMTLADQRGLALRLHVHDQAVALAPKHHAPKQLQTLIKCLTTRPPWADKKLPLKAAGLTTPVFIKD
jgi:DNA polymerase